MTLRVKEIYVLHTHTHTYLCISQRNSDLVVLGCDPSIYIFKVPLSFLSQPELRSTCVECSV